MIKQSKLLKIKNKILPNLSNEKYWLKLKEFNNISGTERVNISIEALHGHVTQGHLRIFDILTLLKHFFEGTAVDTWFLATAC